MASKMKSLSPLFVKPTRNSTSLPAGRSVKTRILAYLMTAGRGSKMGKDGKEGEKS